jgi:LacI family transcriptional regulator
MATLKQIAAAAGVHVVTASAVLNGGRGNTRVGEETAEKVRREAARLGYVRNASAARLRTQKSDLVGFVAGDLRNPFFSEWSSILQGRLRERGLELLVVNPASAEKDLILEASRRLQEQSVRAICYWSETGTLAVPGGRGASPPLFHLGVRPATHPGIWLDLAVGIREAVRYLHERGGTRLGFYGPVESLQSPSFSTRLALFRQICADFGMPEPLLVSFAGESWDVLAAAAGATEAGRAEVDAWVSFNDVAALGLLHGRAGGRRRPVFAFDGTALVRSMRPAVPHLDLQPERCATLIADLVVQAGDKSAGRAVKVTPRLGGC